MLLLLLPTLLLAAVVLGRGEGGEWKELRFLTVTLIET